MKSVDVRNGFVQYFEKQGHTKVASSSLIPENDPTLLFANAGMNQFKNTFLGLEKRDYARAVSVQKCVRAGGKHNDLENVGFTARHHTFFEMMGNFSFGDYFKKEAIHYAWELLTKEYGIPKEKLYVTVHLTDDEAADIWHKQEGIPKDRIFRFDKDNFWKMGDVGPCGPCTEIFYDHGAGAGKISDPFKSIEAGEDRYVEIWNNVFMQYYESEPGKMQPLPKPSVDTGLGYERVVAALQGKTNNYDTDIFAPVIARACSIGGFDYINDPKVLEKHPELLEKTAALRVLADHCRSTSLLIADGALPANEGRGYVLRRIMRRAIRYGRKLSEDKSLLPGMAEALIESMQEFYPELTQRREHVLTTIREEEARFLSTLDNGTSILMDEIKKAKSAGRKELAPETVFKLYDTYGFPADLTRVIAVENGVSVDEGGFEKHMNEVRAQSKASWKGKSMGADEQHLIKFAKDAGQTLKSEFKGYTSTSAQGMIAHLSNGHQVVSSLKAGETGIAILNQTSFYAEGGGQAGDLGYLSASGSKARVMNTTRIDDVILHHIEIEQGTLSTKQEVQTLVDETERRNTANNHSATHLLHSALRKVLGTHVGQAGSAVDSQRTRFDFTHNKPVSADEIRQIEILVNEQIAQAHPVEANVMTHKAALEKGAIAMFGEKYGDQVRVLSMGAFSCELCGGTHVTNTSQIRMFKIISESGVSSGVRRIEAITGQGAVDYAMNAISHLDAALEVAGLQRSPHYLKHLEITGEKTTLAARIEGYKDQIKGLEKEIKKIQGSQINIEDLANQAVAFKTASGQSGKLVFANLAGVDDREVLSQVTDHLKNKVTPGVIVVIGEGQDSHPIIVSVTKDLNPALKAGDLLKELAAIMGGKGGGRPDFAQGAAPNRTAILEAHKKAKSLLGIPN